MLEPLQRVCDLFPAFYAVFTKRMAAEFMQ